MLREAWEEDKCENESVVSSVLTMRKRFEKMSQIMQDNIEAAQTTCSVAGAV